MLKIIKYEIYVHSLGLLRDEILFCLQLAFLILFL